MRRKSIGILVGLTLSLCVVSVALAALNFSRTTDFGVGQVTWNRGVAFSKVDSNHFYIWGGGVFGTTTNQLRRYNVDTDTFTTLANMPAGAIYQSHSYGSYGDFIVGFSALVGTACNTCIYQISTNTWTDLTPDPGALGTVCSGGCFAQMVGDTFYVFGANGGGATPTMIATLNMNNPVGWFSWFIPQPAGPMYTHAQSAYDVRTNRIYFVNGVTGRELWYYDINDDELVSVNTIANLIGNDVPAAFTFENSLGAFLTFPNSPTSWENMTIYQVFDDSLRVTQSISDTEYAYLDSVSGMSGFHADAIDIGENTQLIFGGGYGATTTTSANRRWIALGTIGLADIPIDTQDFENRLDRFVAGMGFRGESGKFWFASLTSMFLAGMMMLFRAPIMVTAAVVGMWSTLMTLVGFLPFGVYLSAVTVFGIILIFLILKTMQGSESDL